MKGTAIMLDVVKQHNILEKGESRKQVCLAPPYAEWPPTKTKLMRSIRQRLFSFTEVHFLYKPLTELSVK